MNVQTVLNDADNYKKVSARSYGRNGKAYVYAPASFMSHIKFGLGTSLVLFVPPLIPGVTGRGLIMGYIGALAAVYSIVGVWGVVRSLHITSARNHGRRSR